MGLEHRPTAPSMQGPNLPAVVTLLVLLVAADVNEIARLGKHFPWVKPSCCPRCQQPLWWHGFVLAYFAPQASAVFLRRLRCSCCKAVHRLKPQGYWQRFRSAVADIQHCIEHRVVSGRWLRDYPRDRQRQWWRRLRKMAATVLGLAFTGCAISLFLALLERGFIPVSTSFFRDNQRPGHHPTVVSLCRTSPADDTGILMDSHFTPRRST